MERRLALLASILLVVILSVPTSAELFSRKIVVNETSPGLLVAAIDRSYLPEFKGLYVSSSSDCSVMLPTWYWSNSTHVVVLFNSSGGDTFYLCYGDIDSPPVDLFDLHRTIYLEASVESPVERYTDSPGLWLYPGDSWSHDFGGTVHIINSTVTGYVYASGTGYLRVYVDGREIYSRMFSNEYGVVTIRTPGGDGQVYRIYADNLYFRVDQVEIYYQRYASNSSSEVLDLSGYNTVYMAVSEHSIEIAYDDTSLGAPDGAVLVSTPWAATLGYSGGERRYPPVAGNVSFTLTVYGYNASASSAVRVLAVNATPADVTYIGAENLVGGAGGAGGSGGAGGNATVVVTTDYRDAIWSAGIVTGLLGVAAIVYAIWDAGIGAATLGLALASSGSLMLLRAGDPRTGYYMLLAGGSVYILALLYFYMVYISRKIVK